MGTRTEPKITAEGLVRDLNRIKKLMVAFVQRDVTFEHARTLMVVQLHVTMGEATDRLKTYEALTGIKLER